MAEPSWRFFKKRTGQPPANTLLFLASDSPLTLDLFSRDGRIHTRLLESNTENDQLQNKWRGRVLVNPDVRGGGLLDFFFNVVPRYVLLRLAHDVGGTLNRLLGPRLQRHVKARQTSQS